MPSNFTESRSFRSTWTLGTQYSGLVNSEVMYLYDAATVISQLLTLALATASTPQGQVSAATGWDQASPIDFYVTGGSITIHVTNQTSVPIHGTLWRVCPRGNMPSTLGQYYGIVQSAYEGNTGSTHVTGAVQQTDNSWGSTFFRYRSLCQAYRVMKSIKFKMAPGTTKRFTFSTKRLFHITPLLEGSEVYRMMTQAFYFNFAGIPYNDNAGALTSLTPGAVAVAYTRSHTYENRVMPYRFNDYLQSMPVPMTTSVMTINQPTVATSVVNA